MNGYPEPVPRPGKGPQPQKPATDSQQRRRAQRPAKPTWNLRLESVGSNVASRFLTESPSMVVLAVEDLCWQAGTEDWKHRRPHWWRRRALAAWHAEGARLETKAEHLRELADDIFQEL